jgi:DNA-directed RNA polymerase subunit RPC12/RpoP
MPRIISHGDRWPRHLDDWVGKTLTCASCGCVFEISEGDRLSRSPIPGMLTKIRGVLDKRIGTETNIAIRCPECSNRVSVNWS